MRPLDESCEYALSGTSITRDEAASGSGTDPPKDVEHAKGGSEVEILSTTLRKPPEGRPDTGQP
jgi:hypothetical protein